MGSILPGWPTSPVMVGPSCGSVSRRSPRVSTTRGSTAARITSPRCRASNRVHRFRCCSQAGSPRPAPDSTATLTTPAALRFSPSLRVPPSSMSRSALAQDTRTDYVAPSGSIGRQYNVARSATLGRPLARSRPGSPDQHSWKERARSAASRNCHSRSPQRFAPGRAAAGAGWRIEAAIDAELSSVHDEIELSPHGVQIEGHTRPRHLRRGARS
jgi:hypothetical protein